MLFDEVVQGVLKEIVGETERRGKDGSRAQKAKEKLIPDWIQLMLYAYCHGTEHDFWEV